MMTLAAPAEIAADPEEVAPGDFVGITQASLERLPPIDLEWKPWPRAFRRVQAKKVELRASRHDFRRVAELRAVEIVSPRLAIVNLFAYPAEPSRLPVFAMEFVRFGGRGIVAVIDLKWVGAGAADPSPWSRELMHAARVAYPDLPYGDDPPGWYQECRSGDDFFLRPANREAFGTVLRVYEHVWEGYARQLEALAEPVSRPLPDAAVTAYKEHHRDNSPGLPFLTKTFGAAWTQRFLHEYYFA